jgi:crotonobetainyl-CoA:carnitine CoA-transferase CaiB-like acyl-CoA transferase
MNAQPAEPVRSPPLEGVRILDMWRLVVGNIMTHVLADMGADVIKMEPPEGDSLRAWKLSGVPVQWRVYCRNKRSLALDLKSEADQATFAGLIETSDILVENFRPRGLIVSASRSLSCMPFDPILSSCVRGTLALACRHRDPIC